MINDLVFYGKYFEHTLLKATSYKIDYLKSIIQGGKIYKFIAFDENTKLNEIKIECLCQDVLWFSHYIYLNDKTEFEINFDVHSVSRRTGRSIKQINYFIGIIKEMYDICSFTYCFEPYMWNEYANNGKGICIVFDVVNYDMLFPVDYVEKSKIDFTKLLADSFLISPEERMNRNDPMALLPFVVKNPMNGVLKSYKEKEIRILYSAYDDGSFNNGIISPQVKYNKKYRGSNVSYEKCGIKVDKIIIGNHCSGEIESKIIVECNKKEYSFEKIIE